MAWGTPWLLDEANPYLLSAPLGMGDNPRVADWIDRDLHSWNIPLLNSLLCPRDVHEIQKLPFNYYLQDIWYWKGDVWGHDTVKDGYRKFMGEALLDPSFSCWGRLWKIPVAPKVRVCLWRAVRGILPTLCTLISKGLELESHCPVCGSTGETTEHIFLTCPLANSVWNLLALEGNRSSASEFPSWLQQVMITSSTVDLQRIAWTIWVLWKNRNDALWNCVVAMPLTLKHQTIHLHRTYSSNGRGLTTARGRLQMVEGLSNFWRCSVDASLFPGVFSLHLMALSRQQLMVSPKVILILLWLKLWPQGNASSFLSYVGSLLNSCFALISSFRHIEFHFVPRSENVLAHSLARQISPAPLLPLESHARHKEKKGTKTSSSSSREQRLRLLRNASTALLQRSPK
ncbi:unnamed protein product [Cuscuta campestris]|uniref:Reverse transcriptase zinc-binding domain-containing protein n=1 Tax=Cuscuta campestris TaxID=132261 RepID=A0A484LDI1_9ASTE|nr:unnamed protein product [Cuscuta campestris]